MPTGITTFKDEWLIDARFKQWVTRAKNPKGEIDKWKAHCSVCNKNLDISSMGAQALTSHMKKSTTHAEKMMARKTASSLVVHFDAGSGPAVQGESSGQASQAASANVPNQILAVSDDVTKAEILWTLHAVVHHNSMRSIDDLGRMLRRMFENYPNPLTDQFSLGRTKASYLTTFGLKPYIEDKLKVDVNGSGSCYVIMFDEAMNSVVQRQQMDLVVRYWDTNHSQVCTRYMGSAFLGTQAAVDLLVAFKNNTACFHRDRLIRVSMDGPSVNWKFLKDLNLDRTSSGLLATLNMGSCGLHVLHGAFRTGHKAAEFCVNEVLRGAHALFDDSPARTARYKEKAKTDEFPKKFCTSRWLQNADPARRIIDIYDDVKSFVLDLKPEPQTAGFRNLKSGMHRNDMVAQFHFFEFVAVKIEPFLIAFQSPNPLSPYLADELDKAIRSLLRCFVKPEVLAKCSTHQKLSELDLKKDENLLLRRNIVIGSGAAAALKSNSFTEQQRLQFHNQCRQFLRAMVEKLYERSPLGFKLCRLISALSPDVIKTSFDVAAERFRRLAAFIYEKGWISSASADRAGDQFADAVRDPDFKDMIVKFCPKTGRLDDMYSSYFGGHANREQAFDLIKKILVLSHGNAPVESGFSINKLMLVENMKEDSIVAQRLVYNYVNVSGGLFEVDIDKPMIKSVNLSCSRYKRSLDAKRSEDQQMKRKAEGAEKQILLLNAEKAKRQKLIEENNAQIASLDREIAQIRPVSVKKK